MPSKKIKILIFAKCPCCGEGDLFKHPLGRTLDFWQMHRNCSVCGASFEPEPGFYFGAMYISYAFTVAVAVFVSLLLYIFFSPPDWVYITAIISTPILLAPISFRYSRVLFLYFFGGMAE